MRERRTIYNFGAGNDLFEEIITDPSVDPDHYEQWLRPMRNQLSAILLQK